MRFSQPFPVSKHFFTSTEAFLSKETISFLKCLLLLPSYVYALCIKMRHFLFDKGVWEQKKCGIPVVSVGNLVTGGTGKTPFVFLLARTLAPFGKIAILSRGYGASTKKKAAHLVTRGEDPSFVGDEPALFAEKLPECLVIVDRDRVRGARRAVREGASLIILDDGMQHRSLFREIDIVLIDAVNPFGGGHYLPAGLLRDDPRRLKQAALIVTNGSLSLKPWTEAPLVEYESRVVGITYQEGISPPKTPCKAALFCGIAHPERFVKSVERLGFSIVGATFLKDHEKMEDKKLVKIAKEAVLQGAEVLLCTEKDRIKLRGSFSLPLPLGWVRVESCITKQKEAFTAVITAIQEKMGQVSV